MQVINKNLSNEPDSFKAWKVKHPNATTWKSFTKNVKEKKELQDALLKEQGYLCCYCCRSITNATKKEEPTVEHFELKALYPDKTFDYANLLVSCNAAKTCNKGRGEKILTLNPCKTEDISQISFEEKTEEVAGKEITGFFVVSSNDIFNYEINNVLNLNEKHLLKDRTKKVVEKVEEDIENYENLGLDPSELELKYTQKNRQHKYPTFAPLALWYLNRLI